jgi:hypothetical protein
LTVAWAGGVDNAGVANEGALYAHLDLIYGYALIGIGPTKERNGGIGAGAIVFIGLAIVSERILVRAAPHCLLTTCLGC